MKMKRVLVGELEIDSQGFAYSPEASEKIDAAEYVGLYPSVYRIEERPAEETEPEG
jgi:hypothetical protein